MSLPLFSLVVILLAGASFARPARAQAPDPGLVMKRVVKPDTPQNAALADATERGDLAAVQAALRQGASADTVVGWEGQPQFFPIALLAAQSAAQQMFPGTVAADKRQEFLPIFRLLIQHAVDPNAADEDTGRTLLIAAVDLDDLPSVKALVEKGADVNARQRRWPAGASALSCAVGQGGVRGGDLSPVTAYLLDHGAAVNVVDEYGVTPLMLAAEYDKIKSVRALLARGADITLRDKHGWTALRYADQRGWARVVAVLRNRSPMDLHEAAQFGDAVRVRAHLDAGEDPNAPDALGVPPLMTAMQSGSVETARLLLDRGAGVGRKDRNGRTALHLAALYGDTALVGLLLDRGADVNAVIARPSGLTTPLTNAVYQAQADVVALLLRRGADVTGEPGAAALQVAVREAGNAVRRPRDAPKALLPRADAVDEARWRVIDLLLGAGADVRADGSRALFLAASGGQAGIIELFLGHGADVNARGPVGSVGSLNDGATALMGAMGAWCGAKTDEELIKDGSLSGPSLADVRESQAFGRRSVELLLAHGADANLPDARGQTPLMACVSSDLPALVKMLLAHGARVNATDPAGRTALMRAAAADDRALAALLLAHHADANRRDTQGRTALMLAVDDGSNDDYGRARVVEDGEARPAPDGDPPTVRRSDFPNPDGHPTMVRLLLGHGAAVGAVAADGSTALSLARRQGFKSVEALLTRAGAGR